jgi:hypothetical protein
MKLEHKYRMDFAKLKRKGGDAADLKQLEQDIKEIKADIVGCKRKLESMTCITPTKKRTLPHCIVWLSSAGHLDTRNACSIVHVQAVCFQNDRFRLQQCVLPQVSSMWIHLDGSTDNKRVIVLVSPFCTVVPDRTCGNPYVAVQVQKSVGARYRNLLGLSDTSAKCSIVYLYLKKIVLLRTALRGYESGPTKTIHQGLGKESSQGNK